MQLDGTHDREGPRRKNLGNGASPGASRQRDGTGEYRQPPYSLEAEQALLGAILVNNAALERVADFVRPEHFFDPLHQQIFTTCGELISKGRAATPITLRPFFESAEPIDATMTVPKYLGRLAAYAVTIINARDYGRTIVDLSTRRQLILIGEDIVNVAYDSPVDFPPGEQIEEAEARLFSLSGADRQAGRDVVLFRDAVAAAAKQAADAHHGRAKPGLDTGLIDLDDMLGGLQPGELAVLAGRPSMGKTALATNVARHVAQLKKAVGFFSQEMSAEQLALRVIGEQAEVAPDEARRGKLEPGQYTKFIEQAAEVGALPIPIDETAGLAISQLVTRARRMKRKHDIGLVIVDYLQLMHAGKQAQNRNLEIAAITAGLKGLAKDLHVPVLVLSQLSREVERRADKRPQLADLRDSGTIEQDADVVMFVYREEYYLRREKPPTTETDKYKDWNARMVEAGGKAEIIIAKQRQGATGIVHVAFSETLMRFSNLSRREG